MSEPLSFTDIKRVHWGATMHVNMLRAAAAGLVFGLLTFVGFLGTVFKPGTIEWPLLAGLVVFPLVMPLCYLGFFLPIGLLGGLLAKMDNIVGTIGAWFVLIAAVFMMVGDPIVYFIHRAKPEWVPIERYPFLGFTISLYVLRPPAAG